MLRPGPLLRVDVALDRGVLGRQPEGVPAHRVEHAPALLQEHAEHAVAQDVVAAVPDVQVPRRVREHHQHVQVLLARRVDGREPLALPDLLPLPLEVLRIIRQGHTCLRRRIVSYPRPHPARGEGRGESKSRSGEGERRLSPDRYVLRAQGAADGA